MLLKGDSGENEYGYDPLDETGAGADATSEEKYQLDDSCALIHEVSPEKLINAANDGNVALVNELLEKDADVNAANKDGMTALMFASGRGHTETAKLLIEKGADVNAADKNGMTALMVASVNGRTEMAKLLIEKGADVNVTGKDGRTTLMLASGNGHTETAKFLIEKGVDVNSVINNGLTALMLASSFGHTETVKLLREKGADVNTVNKYGHTALMLASENGHTETAKLLREKGAKPEAGNAVSNHAKYQSYTGSGVCDVCNRSLSGVKAYVVPNNVFYNSPKWRAHFKKVSLVGATDADIERMRSIDKSQGSAICENCIHMF
jgi:ankyrin repeat protein